MQEISVKEALSLVKKDRNPSVSIFLRTDYGGRDAGGTIRRNMKRLMRSVESMLIKAHDHGTAERLLGRLKSALSTFSPGRGRGGLAIYHSDDFTGYVRLATPVQDLAVAADSFHVKPVLKCVQLRQGYFFLALRKYHAELFLVSSDGLRRLSKVSMFPSVSLGEGLVSERLREKPGEQTGKRRQVRDGIESLISQLEGHWTGKQIPMLLAGSAKYQRLFRDRSRYPYLLEQGIFAAVDHLEQAPLIDIANEFMEAHFARLAYQTVIRFRKARASGLTSVHLAEVAQAVVAGQVEDLIVAEDRYLWGRLDRITGKVGLMHDQPDGKSDDLLDDLAELTLLHGGRVTVLPAVQMPEGKPVVAIFRWPGTQAAAEKQEGLYQANFKRISAGGIWRASASPSERRSAYLL